MVGGGGVLSLCLSLSVCLSLSLSYHAVEEAEFDAPIRAGDEITKPDCGEGDHTEV